MKLFTSWVVVLTLAACTAPPALDRIERYESSADDQNTGFSGGRLRVDPDKSYGLVNDLGPVWLTGIIVAGGDHGYPDYGWPFAHNPIITEAAQNGANYVHFRLGPYRVGDCSPNPPDRDAYQRTENGRYDLDAWNPEFWIQLRARVRHALANSMYVEVDLVDAWPLESDQVVCGANDVRPKRNVYSPWACSDNDACNNLQHESYSCDELHSPPPPRIQDFVRKVADEIGDLDNVIFQVGNETGVCDAGGGASSGAWENGIIQTVRDRLAENGMPDHLFATNSEQGAIEASRRVNYVELHSNAIAEVHAGKPTMVNEYGDNSTPDKFMRDTWESFSRGTMRHYWFGEIDDHPTVSSTLARMAAFRRFVNSVPFGAYRVLSQGVSGIAGSEWFAFTRTGAPLAPMDLGPIDRTFRLDWIDPVIGLVAQTATFIGHGVQAFAPPTAIPWALRVRAGAPLDAPWENDRFDDLAPGPLDGQNGWQIVFPASTPIVVDGAVSGRELVIDSPPLAITVTKEVIPVQTAGRHRVEVAIRASAGVVNASVAKLEVKTGTGAAWDKLFQIFAGNSIRVNYASNGASLSLVPSVTSGATYLVRCDLDLATGVLSASVNGGPVQTVVIEQTDRRIGRLAILGWDLPGSIVFDDISGRRLP